MRPPRTAPAAISAHSAAASSMAARIRVARDDLSIPQGERSMKLYYHPVSTVSRPVVLFAADSGIPLDYQVVDLMKGEHMQDAYGAVNPSRLVPVLKDGDFRLTESSAILKYLADKVDSPAYPKD